jgi:hypothetical protein
MTAQRQERNGIRSGIGFRPGIALIGLLAGLVGPGGLVAPGPMAHAQTTERVIVNRYTGLAIEGYDPVAYFATAKPERGRPDLEASESGAVWRFRNEGNRASFVAYPEIYGPQFGGYDPTELARGVTFAGNPRFWLIVGQRLYLFGREETRDAFAADPANILQEAKARWPELENGLAR